MRRLDARPSPARRLRGQAPGRLDASPADCGSHTSHTQAPSGSAQRNVRADPGSVAMEAVRLWGRGHAGAPMPRRRLLRSRPRCCIFLPGRARLVTSRSSGCRCHAMSICGPVVGCPRPSHVLAGRTGWQPGWLVERLPGRPRSVTARRQAGQGAHPPHRFGGALPHLCWRPLGCVQDHASWSL